MNSFHFYVFSYNRGEFLANCVQSIEDCVPDALITVIDDESTDCATREELASIERRHRVMYAGTDTGHKHGGLYENMQTALHDAEDDALACFVQDDTQVIRKVDDGEIDLLYRRFDRSSALGFVSPCFVRGRTLQRKGGSGFTYDSDMDLFFPMPSRRSAGTYYSDIFIASVGRLRASAWEFATGEPANQRAAMARFGRMGYLRCPFMMWLPNVPAYRGRTKSVALRWAERSRGCGFYPLEYMTDSTRNRLARTHMEHPPIAEQWLTPRAGNISTPWIYEPLHGSRWLKYLNRLELLMRSVPRTLARRVRGSARRE